MEWLPKGVMLQMTNWFTVICWRVWMLLSHVRAIHTFIRKPPSKIMQLMFSWTSDRQHHIKHCGLFWDHIYTGTKQVIFYNRTCVLLSFRLWRQENDKRWKLEELKKRGHWCFEHCHKAPEKVITGNHSDGRAAVLRRDKYICFRLSGLLLQVYIFFTPSRSLVAKKYRLIWPVMEYSVKYPNQCPRRWKMTQ